MHQEKVEEAEKRKDAQRLLAAEGKGQPQAKRKRKKRFEVNEEEGKKGHLPTTSPTTYVPKDLSRCCQC